MVPQGIDRAMAENIFHRFQALSADPGRYIRVICAGKTALGVIHDVGIRNGTAELGWALLPAHHGRGYCTDAVRLAIGELRILGLRTITAGAFFDNPASLRVMEKNGMKRTGFQDTITYRGEDRLCIYHTLDLEDSGNG